MKEIVVEPACSSSETSLTDMLYQSSFQESIIVVGMIKFPIEESKLVSVTNFSVTTLKNGKTG